MSPPVTIVGGGFSGAMLAARLAEAGQACLLIERTGRFGPGVAYSTPYDAHVLNVRAHRMSARDDRPEDFIDWLRARHPDWSDPQAFVPRRLYGLYVQDRLAEAAAAHPGRIERIEGEAVRIDDDRVVLADGRSLTARAVVLATGNPPPRTAQAQAARIVSDPWAEGALEQIGADDAVLIVGSGLTMVDMVLGLESLGWRGRAVAVSRRGLLPHAHLDAPDAPAAPSPALIEGPASARLRAGRALAATAGWRPVMEGLRPITARLWAGADPAVRGRLLRHLRPYWDVHRHRVAPEVAATIRRLIDTGRLTVERGRIRHAEGDDAGVRVEWTPRSGEERPPLAADWLIDCSGPGHDAAHAPLTAALITERRARLDTLGLGLDLDPDGRVLGADGAADPRLFVIGPPARAAFWETVAVPDIRQRIAALADVLAAAPPHGDA